MVYPFFEEDRWIAALRINRHVAQLLSLLYALTAALPPDPAAQGGLLSGAATSGKKPSTFHVFIRSFFLLLDIFFLFVIASDRQGT